MTRKLLLISFAILLSFGLFSACDDEESSTPEEDQMEQDAQDMATDSATTSGLYINEACPRPAEGHDWFELYNAGDQAYDLSACTVVDDNPEHTPSALPVSSVAAGEFLVIEAVDPDEPEPPAGSVPFKLGRSDALILKCGDETFSLAWIDIEDGQCYGPLPDGTGEATLLSPTPGAANQGWE